MHVLVIGGTGFLGYHATHELLRRGHEVGVLALPPPPSSSLFPESVGILMADIGSLDNAALLELLSPYDAIVFAAGADDRASPSEPAWTFYYEANVRTSVRLAAAAREAGVERMVILGSYFTHFDRVWPEMKIAESHPYVYSRREQLRLGTAQ